MTTTIVTLSLLLAGFATVCQAHGTSDHDNEADFDSWTIPHDVDPVTLANVADMAEEAVQAARDAYPHLEVSPEMGEALRKLWQYYILRGPLTAIHDMAPDGTPVTPPEAYFQNFNAAGEDSTIPPADTVSTYVKTFLDLNEDGIYQPGTEPPLPGIQVGNGTTASQFGQGSVLTDANGEHVFTTPIWDHRFVFVTVPAGYLATNDFYHRITYGVAADTVCFGLKETPETQIPNFRLVQMTDMQVVGTLESGLDHGEDIDEAEALTIPPEFLVFTGDLVMTGDRQEQYSYYLQGSEGHDTPIHHGYGDHDGNLTLGQLKIRNFENWLGSTLYSFEYGDIHFVMLNDVHSVDISGEMKQVGWLFADLLAARARNPNIRFIICKHDMAKQEELDLYHLFPNVVAVLAGHWHGSRLRNVQDILDVVSPPSRYGGFDKSSRGFRIVDIDPNGMQTTYRDLGINEHSQVVYPAEGDTLVKGPLELWANGYSTSRLIESVTYWLDGPTGTSPIFSMTQQTSWAWSGTWDATLEEPGAYTLNVQFDTEGSGSFSETVNFELTRGGYATPPDPYTDWPQFKHNAQGTGYTPHGLDPPLRLAWATSLGSPVNVPSPVVADGRVYIGTSNTSSVGEARFVCLDAITGNILWEVPARTDVASTPSVEDGAVYFTNTMGVIFKLDALTGDILWQTTMGDSLRNWEQSSPTIYNGRVYVGGSSDRGVLDATTGDILWSEPFAIEDHPPAQFGKPAVNDDVAVFTSKAGIFVHDSVTGVELWSQGHEVGSQGKVHRSAALTDSLIYTAGNVFYGQTPRGYDPMTGNLDWLSTRGLWESTSGVVVGPGPDGATRYITVNGGKDGTATTFHGYMMSFLPPETNNAWSFWPQGQVLSTSAPYQRHPISINSTPAWTGDNIYFGTDDGRIYCLNPANGGKRWDYDLGVPIRSSPAIAGNMLFINGSDGTLYAFVASSIDPTASVGDAGSAPSPVLTRLGRAVPNPFNPSTRIHFDIGTDAGAGRVPVELKVYDGTGRHVRTLIDRRYEQGSHSVVWDGRNDSGRRVASSVYFYELKVGDRSFRSKVILAK